jgi:hypothetical protein
MSLTVGSGLLPLADVASGERFEVVEIVFDTVRQMCPTIGLHPADVLTCEGKTLRDLILRTGNGRRIVIDRFYASFVAIHLITRDGSLQSTSATRGTQLM